MFCFLRITTYAEFDPDHIPEEEQSAVAADYYDEVDKRIDEKVRLLEQFDNTLQNGADPDVYIRDVQTLLNKPGFNNYKDHQYPIPQLKSAYANYVRENAAAYAIAYANSHNSAYIDFRRK